MKAQRINNRIVVADDERSARLLLCQFLSKKGYETFEAKDGYEAINMIETYVPNIAILDLSMPGLNGLEVVRDLKENGNFPLLYTILLTGYNNDGDEEKALQAGANAFLPKPCDLSAMMNNIRLGLKELEQKRALCIDSLTHIYTADMFTRFLTKLEDEISHDRQEPGSLLIFDLDHFKGVNVTFGHEVGDQVIARFAELIGDVTRKKDIPCRISGDRFAVILPEADKDAALMIGQRIIDSLGSLLLPEGIRLSVTTGGARYINDSQSMFEKADHALAEAKKKGRGTISFLD